MFHAPSTLGRAIPLLVDRCAYLGKLSPQAPHNPCAVSKVAAEALWGWTPQSFRQQNRRYKTTIAVLGHRQESIQILW